MAKAKAPIPTVDPHYYLIDTHCHLDMNNYSEDIQDVLDNAYSNGVRCVVTIGIDLASSKEAAKLAKRYPMVKATAGVHPHDVSNLTKDDLNAISAMIDRHQEEIVGYGEIGLDYVKQYSPQDTQIQAFKDQLSIAKNFDLPVVIHDREAHEDILNILRQFAPFDKGGIMHCFSGDVEYAKKVLDLGFHISIPGIVTFKNAAELREVAKEVPAEALLLETDGPFLAPVPYRGKRNEPLYLLYTAQEIAQIRGITIEEIARITTANAEKLFDFICRC